MTPASSRTGLGSRARALLLALGGVLCLAVILVEGLGHGKYQIFYGRHGWSQPEIAFMLHYLLFGLPAVLCLGAALGLATGERLARLFEQLRTLAPGRALSLMGGAAAATFLLITMARTLLLRDTPITDDENVYVFMANTLASGRLYVPSLPEPVRAFFDNQFTINTGKWYGIYMPGHPAVLAIGARLHVLEWVPRIAATLTVPLAFLVARRIFGQRVALLTTALLIVSPFFILSSATLLAHSTAGLLLLTFAYSALRIHEAPGAIGWWLAAGLGLGWAGLTRPLSAAAFALPWVLWLAWSLWRHRDGRSLVGGALFVVAGLASLATFCAYNIALSGDPFTTGYHTFGRLHRYPFTLGALVAPAPLPAIHELGYTVARLHFWLFGWPASLALVPFFRRSVEGTLLFLGTAAVVVAYALSTVPSINVVGPVHYADLVAPLAMLSASGLERLAESVRGWAPSGGERLVLAAPLAAVACAILIFLPVYGGGLRAMSALTRAPYDLVESRGLDNAVVFVHSLPALHVSPGAWVYYHRNNSPDLSDRVLFVRDLGAERNRELMRFLPGRAFYRMGLRGTELLLVPAQP